MHRHIHTYIFAYIHTQTYREDIEMYLDIWKRTFCNLNFTIFVHRSDLILYWNTEFISLKTTSHWLWNSGLVRTQYRQIDKEMPWTYLFLAQVSKVNPVGYRTCWSEAGFLWFQKAQMKQVTVWWDPSWSTNPKMLLACIPRGPPNGLGRIWILILQNHRQEGCSVFES